MINYAISNIIRKKECLRKYGCKNFRETNQGLIIEDKIMIAKKKNRFKILGNLDWVYYPNIKLLYKNLKEDNIDAFFKEMSKHEKSPPNVWRNKSLEKNLKARYLERSKETERLKQGIIIYPKKNANDEF